MGVLDGRITFDVLVHRAKREFMAMAAYLIRKWTPPDWHTIDDVYQDLLVGVNEVIWKFDKGRGVSIERFVIYNSISYAKRELHRARDAKLSGTADKNPSRFDRSFSSMGEDSEHFVEMLLASEPEAEQLIIAAEERAEAIDRALAACTSSRERIAVRAIHEAGGSLDDAAAILFEDIEIRRGLGLKNEQQARRYMRAAVDVAERLVTS